MELDGRKVRIGVVSGLGNAHNLIEKIKSGEEHFDLVEVMACPYGCISGAGQPFCHKVDKKERLKGMYKSDNAAPIKRSEEKPCGLQPLPRRRSGRQGARASACAL